MPRRAVGELSTEDFGRWAARSRFRLPPPLDGGYAGRFELPWEELLAVSDDRVEIRNAGSALSPRAHLTPKAAELLTAVEPLLREPQWGVFAARGGEGVEQGVLVAGFARGDQGLVVVDGSVTVTVAHVNVTDLAQEIVSRLPRFRPLAMPVMTVPVRGLEVMGAGIGPKGLTRAGRAAAQAAGVSPEQADLLLRVERTASAKGFIAALSFGLQGGEVVGTGAEWFESPRGAVIKSSPTQHEVRLEPATAAAMVRVVAHASNTARRQQRGLADSTQARG